MSIHTPGEYAQMLQRITNLPCEATILVVGPREHLQGWLHDAQILHAPPVRKREELGPLLPPDLHSGEEMLQARLEVTTALQQHPWLWSDLLQREPALAQALTDLPAAMDIHPLSSPPEQQSIANGRIAHLVFRLRPLLLTAIRQHLRSLP